MDQEPVRDRDHKDEIRELLASLARRTRIEFKDDLQMSTEIAERITTASVKLDPPEPPRPQPEVRGAGQFASPDETVGGHTVVRRVMRVAPGGEGGDHRYLPVLATGNAVVNRRNGRPVTGAQPDKLFGIVPRNRVPHAVAGLLVAMVSVGMIKGATQHGDAPESGTGPAVTTSHVVEAGAAAVPTAEAAAPKAAEAPATAPTTTPPASNSPPAPELAVALPASIPILTE